MKYQDLAIRTECPYDVPFLARWSTIKASRLIHAVLGILSEIEELQFAIDRQDKINTQEEVADIQWYCAIIADIFGFELETPTPKEKNSVKCEYDQIVGISSALADMLKKWIFYGKEYTEEDFKTGIQNITYSCAVICNGVGITLEEARHRNIEKLRRRYPGKFTEDDAINRDLEQEKEALINA